MSTNPKSIYNEFIRANLPVGITYDEVRAQYVTNNGKRFPTYLQAKWYLDYIIKFGYSPEFSIASLFSDGEPGAWYDPSDLSTLFQDNAGTTPVTTSGQTVGLMLDKSQGLTLGPELVTNGDFDTNLSGWTNSNWAWSSGTAVTTGAFGTLTQLIGGRNNTKRLSIGYVKTSGRVQCQLIDSTASNPTASLGGAVDMSALGASPISAIIPSGYDTIRFTTTDASAVWSIDNISVKELPGNHATQATAAARPTYQTDGTLHWLEFDGVDDGLSLIYPTGQRTSNMQMVLGVEQDPAVIGLQVFLTSEDSSNNPYVTLYADGGGNPTENGSGTPTHHVNNSADVGNRNGIFDSLNVGAPVVYEARGFDMTTSTWVDFGTQPSFGYYRTGSFNPGIDFYGLIILADHTAEELTSTREWMANKIGVTL